MNLQSAIVHARDGEEERTVTKLPPPSVMYRALVERDSTFEGIFYVGVTSTGIFCRPTCPARKPKQENVEFFPTSQEALYAGYRPCNRCKPLDRDRRPPELVTRLLELVEQSPSGRITGRELRDMGIDPSTARRQFQRHYGMTFQAYHRARRMGRALHEIRKGESVIGAQIDHGFESASGFWEAFKQLFGTPPSKAEQVEILFARWIETPLGAMLALANDRGLYLLEFVDRRGLENEIVHLRKRTEAVIVPGNHEHLDSIVQETKAYFDGELTEFVTPIVQIGSDFEKSVWALLRTIPPGQTRSYAWMAQKLNNPNATRAVGRANGRNPLAIIVPCHRVIRSDGSLC
ncbi:MAG TPA: trifunctional transcriptional activator/DNA repair protein Ada/methylated-DNA--[protein]-cysteine S-methyltransferase, partial [candidate division Zixibacteria bacterium]|nr:trifunctional transcriptional activator/DNA repair protein Ada/methylated-DNA--[protein]-cysteine S-methyltransferase [candidate division Zixibacteria bacterium]